MLKAELDFADNINDRWRCRPFLLQFENNAILSKWMCIEMFRKGSASDASHWRSRFRFTMMKFFLFFEIDKLICVVCSIMLVKAVISNGARAITVSKIEMLPFVILLSEAFSYIFFFLFVYGLSSHLLVYSNSNGTEKKKMRIYLFATHFTRCGNRRFKSISSHCFLSIFFCSHFCTTEIAIICQNHLNNDFFSSSRCSNAFFAARHRDKRSIYNRMEINK